MEDRQYGVLLAVVVGAVVLGPYIFGDQAEAITGFLEELQSPTGLLVLTLVLLLTIQFLSSNRAPQYPGFFPIPEPDTLSRLMGGSPSPVGVALVLVLVLFLLQHKVSLFGGGGDEDGGDE